MRKNRVFNNVPYCKKISRTTLKIPTYVVSGTKLDVVKKSNKNPKSKIIRTLVQLDIQFSRTVLEIANPRFLFL